MEDKYLSRIILNHGIDVGKSVVVTQWRSLLQYEELFVKWEKGNQGIQETIHINDGKFL